MINKGIEHRDIDRPCMLGFMLRMLALFSEWSTKTKVNQIDESE